jgi:hypothetical protein
MGWGILESKDMTKLCLSCPHGLEAPGEIGLQAPGEIGLLPPGTPSVVLLAVLGEVLTLDALIQIQCGCS